MKQFILLPFALLFIAIQLQAQKPELFILSVGIALYKDSRLNLNYAANDARDLAEALQNQTTLYDIVDIKVLTDGLATRNNIRQAFDDFQKKVTGDDLFVFIYSGHGMEDALVPYDFDFNDPYATTLSKNDLRNKLTGLQCNHIILLDACHSGSFAKNILSKNTQLSGDYRLSVEKASEELSMALSQSDKTTLTLTSSSSDQESFECPGCQNGYFAQAILDCLDGKSTFDKSRNKYFEPDNDGNGFVSITEFEKFVAETVRIMTASLTYPQKVRTMKLSGDDFSLFQPNNRKQESAASGSPQNSNPIIGTDRDHDGVPDTQDKCPDVWAQTPMGCPDADNDGIQDAEDQCQYLAGEAKWMGCPDSDGDGVPDQKDHCPMEKGPSAESGCPLADGDRDGVPNASDRCPDVPGKSQFQGCPDTDTDGIPDVDDGCPTEKGSPLNKGCPEKTYAEMHSGNFALIKGGVFSMGLDSFRDARPVHDVSLGDFYLAQTEVTIKQFKAFVDATGYITDAERIGSSDIENENGNQWITVKGINWRCDATGQTADLSQYNHPVKFISWNDAIAYCEWLAKTTGKPYRLPTEAEWEYAAGNGAEHTRYAWGNEGPTGKNGGNVLDVAKQKLHPQLPLSFNQYNDGFAQTSPVGFFNPNKLGLFDISGNVWEWCSDWYKDAYEPNKIQNPQGPQTGTYRIIRGGSWNTGKTSNTIAYRYADRPSVHNACLGFRVARSVNY